MAVLTDATLLVFDGLGLPIYSARGLQQTLNPIDESKSLKRTINGALIDLSVAAFRKYTSTITGNDQSPPSFDDVWPGRTVTVDCIAELGYKTAGGAPARTVVSSRTEGDYTFYRPRLVMKITDYQASFDEWGAVVSWSLTLEEV